MGLNMGDAEDIAGATEAGGLTQLGCSAFQTGCSAWGWERGRQGLRFGGCLS